MEQVTFELEGKEYSLPNYLSIDNYIKIYKIKDFLGEHYFQAKIINAITGVKMEKILETNHNQINFISDYILSLFPDNNYPFFNEFQHNDIEYGFIPSWKNMSFAEFVDLDTLMTKKPMEIIQNLHIICAIMYRPITKRNGKNDFDIEKYDPKEMVKRAEMFKKELDVKYVLGGQFFFIKFVNKYSDYSPLSLKDKMKMRWIFLKIIFLNPMRIWRILSKKDLDGSQLSIELAGMTLPNMKPSWVQRFWERLTNFFTLSKRIKK